MAEHEVTLGEVYRRLGEALLELREMRKDLIGRAEYESDREATRNQFARVDDNMKDWRDTSTAEHVQIRAELKAVKLDARSEVTTLRERMDKAEERGKNQRWAVILAIIAGGVSLVIGVVGVVVQGAIGP